MVDIKTRWKFLVLLAVSALMVSGAAAVEPQIDIAENDNVIWKNDGVLDSTVNFQITCNGTTSSEVFVWDGNRDYSVQGNSSAGYFINTSARQMGVGTYQVVAECAGGDQSTKEFQIDRLSLDIQDVSNDGEIFLGKSFESGVFIQSELGNLNLGSLGYPELFLKESGESYDRVGELKVKDQRMTISSSTIENDFISSDSEDGEVRVAVEYNQRTSKDLNYQFTLDDEVDVSIKRWAIDFNAIPSRRISQEELSDLNISLKMMYEGEPVTPSSNDIDFAGNFYLARGDTQDVGEYEWFSGGFRDVSEEGDYGEYMLSLEKMPKLDVGDHTLDVYFESEDYGPKKVGTVYVEKKFTFDGRVADSDSRAVDTRFILKSGDYLEEFSTDSRGVFSRRMVPEEYGFDLFFPKGELTLSEVELERNFSGNINYHYFDKPNTLDIDLKGIKPVNMMTVSFGYPFDAGTARMKYNPAKMDDPAQADVFECVEWNFWARECISGWDKIDSEAVQIRPTDWTARFPVTPVKTSEYGDEKKVLYSAYVVGTNSKLEVSRIGVNDYRVASNGNFKATGTVVAEEESVSDADVTFSLMDNGDEVTTGTGTTNSDGEFNIGMTAPEEAGNYTMYVSVEKGDYTPYEEEIDEEVWIYKQKELSLDVPDTMEVTPGESSVARMTLTNGGQVDFENIRLSVDGPSRAEFSLSDTGFNSLEAGDSRTVELNITLPGDFCSPSCAQYPQFDISLTAGETGNSIDKTFELQTQVNRQQQPSGANSDSETNQAQREQDSSQNSGEGIVGSFSKMMDTEFDATGDFLQTQTGLNMALGLITVFTLALAGAIKKNKSGVQAQERRALTPQQYNTSSMQRPTIASEPQTLSPGDDIDEIADAMDGDVIDISEGEEDEHDPKDVDEESWFARLEREEDHEDVEEAETEEVEISQEEGEEDSETESGEQEAESVEEVGPKTEESSVSESGGHTCSECGEEFDTPAGLKLHKQALH